MYGISASWSGGCTRKRALTHHEHIADLKAYAEVATGRVHVDNRVITSAGISSSIDLGLRLLEMIYDEKTARKVADRLELPIHYHSQGKVFPLRSRLSDWEMLSTVA